MRYEWRFYNVVLSGFHSDPNYLIWGGGGIFSLTDKQLIDSSLPKLGYWFASKSV